MNPRRMIMILLFVLGYLSSFFFDSLSAVNDSMVASPKPILSYILFGLVLTLFPRQERKIQPDKRPRLFRRYLAANIDLSIAGLLLLGFLFPILLVIENSARREWVWSWETAISPFYEPALIIGIFTGFIGIYFYFKIHLEHNRSTPGQYIMGYKIVPVGLPNYNRRIWNGLFWMWLCIFAWASRTETKGIYSWDKNSNSQAVRVE